MKLREVCIFSCCVVINAIYVSLKNIYGIKYENCWKYLFLLNGKYLKKIGHPNGHTQPNMPHRHQIRFTVIIHICTVRHRPLYTCNVLTCERKSTCVGIEGVWDVLCISVIFLAFFPFFIFQFPFLSFAGRVCLWNGSRIIMYTCVSEMQLFSNI